MNWLQRLLGRGQRPIVELTAMQKVRLAPGDMLVLMTDRILPDDTCERLRDQLEKIFEGKNKCLVLGDGLKLAVIDRAEPGDLVINVSAAPLAPIGRREFSAAASKPHRRC